MMQLPPRTNYQSLRIFSSRRTYSSSKILCWRKDKVSGHISHSFPDFIEFWNRSVYRKCGYALAGSTSLWATAVALSADSLLSTASIPPVILGTVTGLWFYVGEKDIHQSQHAVRRNYPVLGNIRYILETIRPELRQYIVESDTDGAPFNRLQRNQIYQRAKGVDETLAFGTRKNLYNVNSEWICQSMFPKTLSSEDARHTIGCTEYGTLKPYSSSILNISAMSYGAISENAILALNEGAFMGRFSHNTGEGGISKFHREKQGDLVWNIGTGYFGCGTGTDKRMFDAPCFQETLEEAAKVKMIEIKISQGAKPGHGGLLPKGKITKEIADARKLVFPPVGDCHSPSSHSAFSNAHELVEFISTVRELSNGLPVGVKMCIGQPLEIARFVKACHEMGMGPDFITVDGGEGGTGAAPPEFSDSIGYPLEDGLVLVRNLLIGADLKDKISIIASGKASTGFSIVKNLSLGADCVNSARAFMLSLGCIQALKCNTNKCPTGIATSDKDLMYGLVPEEKSVRVFNFHRRTVQSVVDIVGAIGHSSIKQVDANDIMRRIRSNEVCTLAEHYPKVNKGSLLEKSAPTQLQRYWDH